MKVDEAGAGASDRLHTRDQRCDSSTCYLLRQHDSPGIDCVAPVPAVTDATPPPAIQSVALAPSATFNPVIEYVSAAPAGALQRLRNGSSTVTPAFAVGYTESAPVIDGTSTSPADAYAAPASRIEHVAHAPADAHAAPTPVIEHGTPAPVDWLYSGLLLRPSTRLPHRPLPVRPRG